MRAEGQAQDQAVLVSSRSVRELLSSRQLRTLDVAVDDAHPIKERERRQDLLGDQDDEALLYRTGLALKAQTTRALMSA